MSIFEIGMLVGFGFAWPSNIYKSLKSRTAAGRSLMFQWAILFGYICGIINKILYSNDLVLYLYILNFLMVSVDTCLTLRNRRLDRRRMQNAEAAK